MQRIYHRREFVVWHSNDGFIVQNILMNGFAHTHLHNYQTAKYIIDLSIRKKVPHDLSRYLMISLVRINTDEEYLRKLNDLLEHKRKKEMYFNSNKGVRKRG